MPTFDVSEMMQDHKLIIAKVNASTIQDVVDFYKEIYETEMIEYEEVTSYSLDTAGYIIWLVIPGNPEICLDFIPYKYDVYYHSEMGITCLP